MHSWMYHTCPVAVKVLGSSVVLCKVQQESVISRYVLTAKIIPTSVFGWDLISQLTHFSKFDFQSQHDVINDRRPMLKLKNFRHQYSKKASKMLLKTKGQWGWLFLWGLYSHLEGTYHCLKCICEVFVRISCTH